MSNGQWFVLFLACIVAVVGLLLAASDGGQTTTVIGFGMFVVAVIYAFAFVKRHFDHVDQMHH